MIFFKSRKEESEASFKQEALPHMKSLYNAALYMTRNPHEAEDLVQETLMRAHRFWHRYQPGTNCKAWLFRIQTNTFINRNRKKQRTYSLIENADSDSELEHPTDDSGYYSTPESEYMRKLFPAHVQAAVEELPEAFRLPVILADLQDFSYKEIAEIMDCPVGTVMSRLFRGRKRLQEKLFDYAVQQGIIDKSAAAADDGTISLETYRERKKAAGASG